MKKEELFELLGDIDETYVKRERSPMKKGGWMQGVSIAAGFVLVVILGLGLLQGKLLGNHVDVATLDNGDQIIFVESDTGSNQLSLDMDVTFRKLTEEETHTLFTDLPVTAMAIFSDDETAGNTPKLIGLEGTIGDVKLIISTSGLQLLDTVIDGNEENTEVDGIPVTAGYFMTDPNSRGEQNAIYYATFNLEGNIIYVENSGSKSDRETVKNELAAVIQKLIANGALDLSSFET